MYHHRGMMSHVTRSPVSSYAPSSNRILLMLFSDYTNGRDGGGMMMANSWQQYAWATGSLHFSPVWTFVAAVCRPPIVCSDIFNQLCKPHYNCQQQIWSVFEPFLFSSKWWLVALGNKCAAWPFSHRVFPFWQMIIISLRFSNKKKYSYRRGWKQME